jgi:hypothetical protein
MSREYPWSIKQAIDGIHREEEQHGVVLSIGVYSFRGNIGVKYTDGYLNMWRGDCDEIKGWGDEIQLRTALRRNFPEARIRFWVS